MASHTTHTQNQNKKKKEAITPLVPHALGGEWLCISPLKTASHHDGCPCSLIVTSHQLRTTAKPCMLHQTWLILLTLPIPLKIVPSTNDPQGVCHLFLTSICFIERHNDYEKERGEGMKRRGLVSI